jgi:hypothetical protein
MMEERSNPPDAPATATGLTPKDIARGVVVKGIARGLTVKECANRFRVGCAKIRGWIARNELFAINTADGPGKPRWVIPPDAIAAFEARRAGGKPAPRPKQSQHRPWRDYYPDD